MQTQKMVRGLRIWIKGVEELYYLYPAKKILHTWAIEFFLSWSGMVSFNVIYGCLEKSFCNIWMNFELKSKVSSRNCLHLKHLGVILQKLNGAENYATEPNIKGYCQPKICIVTKVLPAFS